MATKDDLPRPEDDEEDDIPRINEDDDDYEDEAPAPKKGPVWVKWVRIASIIAIALFFIFVISKCGGCGGQVEPGYVEDSTYVNPVSPQQPVAQQPTAPAKQPEPTATPSAAGMQIQQGDILLAFNYIIRNGEVRNGESTNAVLHTNGSVTIQINGSYYDIVNPSTTTQNGQIVAINHGNTTYVVNKQVAEDLGLQERSPYKEEARRVHYVGEHVIKSGEKAGQIAQRYGMTIARLKELNRSKDLNYIIAGDKLRVDMYK